MNTIKNFNIDPGKFWLMPQQLIMNIIIVDIRDLFSSIFSYYYALNVNVIIARIFVLIKF